jgi:hypothetical protein
VSKHPSSAGVCQVCGRHADKRYGGEGRYLVMCLDCWLADSNPSKRLLERGSNASVQVDDTAEVSEPESRAGLHPQGAGRTEHQESGSPTSGLAESNPIYRHD